jgi:hypothetical protein
VNESENLLEESKGKRLTFGAPVMYNQSRAVVGEIDGATYPAEESFTVFGIEHKGDFAGWEATNVIKDAQGNGFFPTAGEVVEKGDDGFWYTSTDYYLPTEPDHKLSFAAYSPSRANGTISYGADGLTITDWRMPDTGMYDLMYSTRNTDVKTDVVNIAFLHALSSIHINFAMSTENGPSSVVVTKVAIKGKDTDIKNVGTFNDNIATTTDGTGATWDNLGATNLPTEYVILNSDYTVTTTAAEPTASVDFLPIPQELDNQTLLISYKIKMEGDADYQVVEGLEIPFKNFTIGATTDFTENWERAKRYFYTVTFGGLTKIKFKPSVAGWTDVDNAGTYIIK